MSPGWKGESRHPLAEGPNEEAETTLGCPSPAATVTQLRLKAVSQPSGGPMQGTTEVGSC